MVSGLLFRHLWPRGVRRNNLPRTYCSWVVFNRVVMSFEPLLNDLQCFFLSYLILVRLMSVQTNRLGGAKTQKTRSSWSLGVFTLLLLLHLDRQAKVVVVVVYSWCCYRCFPSLLFVVVFVIGVDSPSVIAALKFKKKRLSSTSLGKLVQWCPIWWSKLKQAPSEDGPSVASPILATEFKNPVISASWDSNRCLARGDAWQRLP